MKFRKHIMLFIAAVLLFTTVVPMATEVLATGGREPVIVSGNFTNVDFNVTTPSVTNGVYTLDTKLLGTVTTTTGQNAAGLVTDANGSRSFYLEADTTVVNSFRGSINKTDRFGIQTRVKFNNTNSKRSIFELKSMNPPSGTAPFVTLLFFDQDGKIKDNNGNSYGNYAADQWYDLVFDVNTPNKRYSAWINGSLVVDNAVMNVNWVGLFSNKFVQNPNAARTPSTMNIAYVKAGSVSDPVPLTSLSIQPLSGDFYVNQVKALTLDKTPSNANASNFNWSSSNPSVATVDNLGVLTGVSAGTATITVASVANPLITAALDVTVSPAIQPVLINPDFLNIDFNNYALQVSGNTTTMDSKFLGTVTTTSGANNAGTFDDDGTQVFYLEAITSTAGTYRGSINKTDRFGIQTSVKFNNTDSRRALFEMKSMTPPSGSLVWPTLLIFDQDGKIKDFKNNVLGNYAANQWYDIVVDMDTPNHRYSVWINGELKVSNLDLGNYVGVFQNKLLQNPNASHTSSTMFVANMRAGTIVPRLQDLVIPDITVDKGKAAVLSYTTVPNPAFVQNVSWTSSDPTVAKVVGNGLLAMNTGTATITATEQFSGISKTFQVTVQNPVHNWIARAISDTDLVNVLWVGHRVESTWTADQIMAANPDLQQYIDMNDSDFIQQVNDASSKLSVPNTQTKFERYARLFALLYKQTNDTAYARKAALILYYQALDYPRIVVNHNYSDFFAGGTVLPAHASYAYGALFDSNIWSSLVPGITAEEVKQTIQELWIRPAAYETQRAMNAFPILDNITPYGVRGTLVTGMLLNDPNLIHENISFLDRFLSNDHFFSDGMWGEETTHYGLQVANNVKTIMDTFQHWADPADYVDTKYGVTLNYTNLRERYPLADYILGFGTDKMIYPDGTPIPVNDSDYKKGDPAALQIVSKGLKNIEMPGYGYFSLNQGDQTDATHAGLAFQSRLLGFAGGHTHTNFLTLDLWGAGIEMLPHTGYVLAGNYPDGSGRRVRFPSMVPNWRNMPWVWRADGANTAGGEWQKPALLAYDPGTWNGKQVQLVEASDPGPEGKGASMARRLVMMVNVGGNRNYTFDLTRLQGGQAHEIYQRGEELEDMDTQVQGIQLTDTGEASLKDYLISINSTEGLPNNRELLESPKVTSGDNSFSFTWTGQQTGSSVRTFMNGVTGSDLFFTKMPAARRINTEADEKKYYTPHLTRRHIVSDPNENTQYGAVYETLRPNQTGEVSNVQWHKSDDNDPMTNIAVVTSSQYTDIIYTSGDTKERTFQGITFAGSVAVARLNTATGELVYSYVYGQGKVEKAGASLVGAPTQELEILATTTASTNLALDPEVRDNTITVKGHFANKDQLVGHWLQTRFSDGSGYGVKVTGFKEVGENTVLTLDQYTPFSVTAQGVNTFYPQVSIPGKAYVVYNLPKLKSDFAPPVTTDNAPTGWTNHDTTVTLSASDASSVVVATYYTVNGGAQQSGNSVVLQTEGVHTLKYWSVDSAGNVEQPNTVTVSIDKSAPNISVTAPAEGSNYENSGTLTLQFTLTDSLSGVDNTKTTVTLDTYSYQPGATISLYKLLLGQHTFIVTYGDLAGKLGSKTVQFRTIATVSSLQALVTHFRNRNDIDSDALADTLHGLLSNNNLHAFVQKVQDQRGKHITTEAATYLLRDAQYVISQK